MSAFRFVGRSHELEVLDNALAEAAAGDGNCVVVSGEAGIGKSRLIAEIRQRARTKRFLVLEGSFEEPDRSVPYAGLAAMLRSHWRGSPASTIAEELGPLAKPFARILPELYAHLPLESASGREAAGEQQEVYEALTCWVAEQVSERPLLMTIEDLHWSDDASQACLAFLLEILARLPLLLILSFRTPLPEPYQEEYLRLVAGTRAWRARHLRLQPLRRHEVAAVMHSATNAKQPVRFYYLFSVFELTGGNPLFVEEICISSTATETVSNETDLRGLHPLPQAAIPRSVRRIIRQRIHGVSKQAQMVADLCAMHRRIFDIELLRALTGYSQRQVMQLCQELIRANLAMQTSEGELCFRHAMIREALCDRLLIRERRALHMKLMAALEELHAGALEAYVADLSYHAYAAGCWRRTLLYARVAAEEALALHAPRAAAAQFTRAIEAANRLPWEPSWELHCRRAVALERMGDVDGTLTDYALALDSARVLGDRHAESVVLKEIAAILPQLDEVHAGEYYRQIVGRLPGGEDAST